jgi:hypothetical protein
MHLALSAYTSLFLSLRRFSANWIAPSESGARHRAQFRLRVVTYSVGFFLGLCTLPLDTLNVVADSSRALSSYIYNSCPRFSSYFSLLLQS